MSWVRDNYWLPERLSDTDLSAIDEYPHLIVSRHANWGLIHDEIEDEQPDYPVRLCVPGVALYCFRIRGYEYRHFDLESSSEFDRLLEWESHVKCRVVPR